MTYQRDRDEFLHIIQEEGLAYSTATKLLRYSQTLHRLATAECNGDYPYNGDRDNYLHGTSEDPNGRKWQEKRYANCPNCESNINKSEFRWSALGRQGGKICVECRTRELVQAALPDGFKPVFSGDPRGCVLKIQVPSGKTNDWGREGLCVPVRDR